MYTTNNSALNAEQTLQDMASAPVINNSTDLNGQPSATGCVAQPSACLPAAAPDAEAGSQSKRKTEVAEETFAPEEFR